MDDGAAKTNARRVKAVALTLRALGMRVSSLRVGDVAIQLSEPWGAAAAPAAAWPPPRGRAEAVAAADAADLRMARLRKVAHDSLGYTPSDDQLEKLAPALIGERASRIA